MIDSSPRTPRIDQGTDVSGYRFQRYTGLPRNAFSQRRINVRRLLWMTIIIITLVWTLLVPSIITGVVR